MKLKTLSEYHVYMSFMCEKCKNTEYRKVGNHYRLFCIKFNDYIHGSERNCIFFEKNNQVKTISMEKREEIEDE